MRKYIFIGIGGVLGTFLRYYIRNVQSYHFFGDFPVSTLAINLLGSFALALLLTIDFEIWAIDKDLRLGIATGILGAFTTFSTFCKETVVLYIDGKYFFAISYVILSIILGLAAAYLGVFTARKVANCGKLKEKSGAE